MDNKAFQLELIFNLDNKYTHILEFKHFFRLKLKMIKKKTIKGQTCFFF